MPSLPSSGATAARGQDQATATGGSSAPVLEFLCLFTHDLRRKQKRWQDGRLKFHTFNKRVMVYDDRGNFVGDMHWTRDYDFDEGEEVQVERGGVIVQVSECVGRQNQDLSELLDKRAREKEQRQSRTVARPIAPAAQPQVRFEHADHPQPLHRPLHQFIGTPTGHHGRALVPTESPFERRQQQQADETPENKNDSRAAKRRKYDETPPRKMGYAQALFGAQLSLSSVPASSAPLRRPTSTASRIQSEQRTSQEQDRRQEEALDEVREISPSSVVRGGLSRTNLIAPLLQARPEPRQTAAVRAGKPVELRPVQRAVAQAKPVSKTAEPPEQQASELGKLVLGSGSRQSATSKMVSVPGKPKPPALSSSVSAGSESRRLADPKDRTAARVKPRNPRSKSIISDQDSGDGGDNGITVTKLQEVTINSLVSKLAGPDARKQKPATRKYSPPPVPSLEPSEAAPKRLAQRPQDIQKVKQAAHEIEEEEEPRVELRIKPRRKRGLLMLSDIGDNKTKRPKSRHEHAEVTGLPVNLLRQNSGVISASRPGGLAQNPACKQNSGNEGDEPSPSPLSPFEVDTETPPFEASFDKPAMPGNLSGNREATAESIYNLPDTSDDEFVTRSPPRRRNQVAQKTASNTPEIQSASKSGKTLPQSERSSPGTEVCGTKDSEGSEDQLPTRNLRKRKTIALYESESEEEEEFPQVPVGPRLASLGRRSVKSREVIGFIPSSSPVPGPTFTMGLLSEPVALDDTNPRSGAKESQAVRNNIDKEPSQSGVGSSLETSQLLSAPIMDADVPLEVDTSPSASTERRPSGNETMTVTSCLLKEEDISVPVAEPITPLQTVGSQDSLDELIIVEEAASTERIRRSFSGQSGDADFAYAGTTGDMQNNAAREKDSAPKTMDPFADTTTILAAVATSTLQSPSHKEDGPPNQQATTPINLPHDVAAPTVTTSAPKTSAAQDSSAGSSGRPRIANPATRGRKAALKSDAAGQVPQSIVPPPEPVLVRPIPRPPQAARSESTVNERPKRVMKFPGFTTARAGGGPWSREADDLLETGRPS